MIESVYETGFEKDRLNPGMGETIRWWVYIFVPGAAMRNQRARLGVIDRGFHFARGGRATDADEAESLIMEAVEVAQHEARFWTGQPSHALGPAGQLIPLDEVIGELPRGAGELPSGDAA